MVCNYCGWIVECTWLLDKSNGFRQIRERFSPEALSEWSESIRCFGRQVEFWKHIRDDVGGHFGSDAAAFALEEARRRSYGFIELTSSAPGKGGAVLGFTSELVAAALLRHLPSGTFEEQVTHLSTELVSAVEHAANAVQCLVVFHLWPRSSRG